MYTYRQQRGAAHPPSGATLLTNIWIGLAAVLLAVPACEGRPSGNSDPAQPIVSTPPSPVESDVFEEVELATGQKTALKSTGLRVLLVDAQGQRPDCVDCPNKATLQATLEGEVKELHFSLSGNMPMSVMARARRKEAHGYVFIMIRIVDDNVRFRIEPADSEVEE